MDPKLSSSSLAHYRQPRVTRAKKVPHGAESGFWTIRASNRADRPLDLRTLPVALASEKFLVEAGHIHSSRPNHSLSSSVHLTLHFQLRWELLTLREPQPSKGRVLMASKPQP